MGEHRNFAFAAVIAGIAGASLPGLAFSQDAMFVDSTGNVGIGTNTPSFPLHVLRSDGSARISVEENSSTTAGRTLFDIRNNGPSRFVIENTNATSGVWSFAVGASPGDFVVGKVGTGVQEAVFRSGGDLTIAGTLTEGSSSAIKNNIAKVDYDTVLAKLDALPITEWSYIGAGSDRHIGPMAEDFYATFALGPDNKHIAPKDLAGVALAAVKALREKNRSLESENAELRERLERLEEHLGLHSE